VSLTAGTNVVAGVGRWSHPRAARAEIGEAEVYRLVARARRGDREALGELYATYADRVFGCVCRILQDPHEAEDVTQHVFLKLMSVLPRYERREVPFSAWLMRVARNAAFDAERKRRPIQCEEAPDGVHEDDRYHHGRSLRDALAALPPAQRQVVVLRHIVGLSASEVGERMGKTAGSIHALDQRGRRTLQGDLIALGSAPATAEHVGRAPLSAVA